MMILLAPHDFQKLSSACRAEILKLVMNGGESSEASLSGESGEVDANSETEEVVNEEKKVLSLSAAEAGNLISKISDGNKQSLRLFATGQSVFMDALVGQDRPYKKYVDLKRNFIGAVNRRLRTVSGNRNAALFTSDREKTRIKVTPRTAESLRRAFGLDEPLPSLNFCDAQGIEIKPDAPQCIPLNDALANAWASVNSKDLPENRTDLFCYVLQHFIDAGFELFVRSPITWNEDNQNIDYEIRTVRDPKSEIQKLKTEPNSAEFYVGIPGEPQVLARPIL
jgi:hypothetical protein